MFKNFKFSFKSFRVRPLVGLGLLSSAIFAKSSILQNESEMKENFNSHEEVFEQNSNKPMFIPNGKTFPYRLNFNIYPEFNSVPKDQQVEMNLIASIQAPMNPILNSEEYRTGIDLIFDLELGDQNWTSLKHLNLRNNINFLIDSLQTTDQVGFVKVNLSMIQTTSNEFENTLFPMNLRSKETTKRYLEKIKQGPPHPFNGILTSISNLRNSSSLNPIKSTFLITDGQPSVKDIPSYEGLQMRFREKFRVEKLYPKQYPEHSVFRNFSAHIFGFGTNYQPILLTMLALNSSGMFYNVPEYQDLRRTFGDCYGGLISTIAHNLCVSIQEIDGVKVKLPHPSFYMQDEPSKNGIHFPNIQLEEKKDLVFRVILPVTSESSTPLKLTFTYFNILTKQHEKIEKKIQIPRTETEDYPVNLYANVQNNRIVAIKSMFSALVYLHNNDTSSALNKLEEGIKFVTTSPTSKESLCQSFIENLRTCSDLIKENNDLASKKLGEYLVMHFNQRSAGSEAKHENVYDTTIKREMRKKFSENVEVVFTLPE